jgi:Lambda phage tail tube protein, TTP
VNLKTIATLAIVALILCLAVGPVSAMDTHQLPASPHHRTLPLNLLLTLGLVGVAIASNQPAINTLLKIGTAGSPTTFGTIANVGDMTGPGFSAQIVDVTSHSTGSPWRIKVPTLLDNGDITCKIFFIPSSPGSSDGTPFGHDAGSGLLAVFTNRQLREYSLTFPDPTATTWYLSGYLTKFAMTAMVQGVLEASAAFTFVSEPQLFG